MNGWLILDQYGKVVPPESFPSRPANAKEANGNPYTPWHRTDEHLHLKNGVVEGIHGYGSESELREVLKYCQKYQKKILSHFETKEDSIDLIRVLKYLTIQE